MLAGVDEYQNMVDISVDIDESFSLSNGIISHNSAAATTKRGFSVTGGDYFGLFPLRGKPLNVKKISLHKMMEDDEMFVINDFSASILSFSV